MTVRFALFPLLAALPIGGAVAAIEASPAALLANRTPQATVNCLTSFQRDQETRLYADGSILYGGRGTTWYLNQPDNCPRFTSDAAIVSVSPTGQLCRGDIIRVVDPVTHIDYGSCTLGSFTPYPAAHHARR